MHTKRIGMAIIASAWMLVGLVFMAKPAKAESNFSIGIGVGPSYGYYAPPPVVYRPPYPGPGYNWTDGYYDPYGAWIAGFWAPRPYVRPYRYGYIAPRLYGGRYYGGFRRGFDRDDFRRGRFDRDDFRGRAFGRRR